MYEDKVTVSNSVQGLFTAFAKLCMGTKALDVEKNDTEHNITVYTSKKNHVTGESWWNVL